MDDIQKNKLDMIYSNLEEHGITYITNAINYKKSIPIQIFDIIDLMYNVSCYVYSELSKNLHNKSIIIINDELHCGTEFDNYNERYKICNMYYKLAIKFNILLNENKVMQTDYDEFIARYESNNIFPIFVYSVIHGLCAIDKIHKPLLGPFTQFIVQNNKLLLQCIPYKKDIKSSIKHYNYVKFEKIFNINLLKFNYIFLTTITNYNSGIVNYMTNLHNKNKIKKLIQLCNMLCKNENVYKIVKESFVNILEKDNLINNVYYECYTILTQSHTC